MHCQFFVQRKNRFCRMTIRGGQRFCGEHLQSQHSEVCIDSIEDNPKLRIPCPFDSKHTCYKEKLDDHMSRCNARPMPNPEFIVPGLNQDHSSAGHIKLFLSDVDDHLLMSVINKVRSIHKAHITVSEEIKDHPVLAADLQRPGLGLTTRKHLQQISSLLKIMEQQNLLQDCTCYLEMGAGRGKLTYWLTQAMRGVSDCSFALVDKASLRHKSENKIKSPELEVLRIKADVADLYLKRVKFSQQCKRVVAVSKHLCGAATDLGLRCIGNAMISEISTAWSIQGLAMAMCCHHRCDWKQYVGKSFFKDCDLDSQAFSIVCSMTSWATCGSAHNAASCDSTDVDGTSGQTTEQELKQCDQHKDRYERLNLPADVREEIGRLCKQIIDFGRCKYIENFGFKSQLLRYAVKSTTLENVCIVATRDERSS